MTAANGGEPRAPTPMEEASASPISLGRLLEMDIPDPEWVLKPYLQTQTVVIIYGDSQTGKTWLLLHWLVILATEGLRVLIVEGEGSLGGTRRRLQLVAKGLGVDLDTLKDRIFVWQNAPIDIREADGIERLEKHSHGFDVTAVDTVSAHAPGSDEDAREMSLIMHGLKRVRDGAENITIGCHHVTKAAVKSGKASMSNASGHSNMKRLADTMIEVTADGEEEEDDEQKSEKFFTITVTKQRDGKKVTVRGALRISNTDGAVFTWERPPEHKAPVFTEEEIVSFLAVLPGPDEAPIGLHRLGRVQKRRPEALRRIAKVCESGGLIEHIREGPHRGIRRLLAVTTGPTGPAPVPHRSRTGAPRSTTTGPGSPVPAPPLGAGPDRWSLGVADRAGEPAAEGGAVPESPDGSGAMLSAQDGPPVPATTNGSSTPAAPSTAPCTVCRSEPQIPGQHWGERCRSVVFDRNSVRPPAAGNGGLPS